MGIGPPDASRSRRLGPFRYSMTRYGWPSPVMAKSRIVTMFGWRSFAQSWLSRMKRSLIRPASALAVRMTLMTTSSPRRMRRAR